MTLYQSQKTDTRKMKVNIFKSQLFIGVVLLLLSACSFDSKFHSNKFVDETAKLERMGIKYVEFSSSAMFTPGMINEMSETVYITTNQWSFSTRIAGAPYVLDGIKIDSASRTISMRKRNREIDADTISWMIKKGLEEVYEKFDHSSATAGSWN